MSEASKPIIDTYGDMTIKEICALFVKKETAVRMGVSRLVKEHPEWKSKNSEGRVVILGPGVQWLADYFRVDYLPAIRSEESNRLRNERDRFKELLDQERQHSANLVATHSKHLEELAVAYQKSMRDQEGRYLLEQQKLSDQNLQLEKERDAAKAESDELRAMLEKLPKWIRKLFGAL